MKIRVATKSDAYAISRLSEELGYPNDQATTETRIERLSHSSDNLVLVAEHNDNAASLSGWIQATKSETIESGFKVEIVGLVVSKDSRKLGLGKALVEEVEQWARSIDCPRVVVRSNLMREESHLFYPKIGYCKTKEQAVYKKNLRVV